MRKLCDSIPNWTMFGVGKVVIQIFQEKVETSIFYTSALLVVLDDGVEYEKEDERKNITLLTSIITNDEFNCIYQTLKHISGLFDGISSMVFIYDIDKKIIMRYDLNKDWDLIMFNVNANEKVEKQYETPEKRILH